MMVKMVGDGVKRSAAELYRLVNREHWVPRTLIYEEEGLRGGDMRPLAASVKLPNWKYTGTRART